MDTIRSHHIAAVSVNHNTSHFVELMLRTLFLTNDLTALRLEMTVLDNQSGDAHVDELRTYLGDQHVAFMQTGFDTGIAIQVCVNYESGIMHPAAEEHSVYLCDLRKRIARSGAGNDSLTTSAPS